MRYHSTRSKNELKTFEEAVLSAYASDGGLYVPDHLPSLPENYRSLWKELSFPDVCAEVFHLFCDIDVAVLRGLCAESYKDFNDGVHHLPLHHFDDLYLLDTSLGPTLAFKDVGQQIMGKIINYLLAQRGERGNIVVETSGDTGPAAIAGVRGSSNVNIFCLYPHGRVSEVQELQMVTVDAPNVFVYRTEGNTDEQASVLKEIFDDHAFLQRHHIFSVNSINIGRIIAQSSYFIWASLQFSEAIAAAGLTVVIPTGAFGNAMGAYCARLMGAPLGRIVCATNANDIVHRTIAYGDLRLDENRQTVSPAMDIQFAYNLERMLYYITDEDSATVRSVMVDVEAQYRALGDHRRSKPPLAAEIVTKMQTIFTSYSVSDEDTLRTIAAFHARHGFVLCPHSATAVYVATHVVGPTPTPPVGAMIAVLTAHPDKFEDTVTRALREYGGAENASYAYTVSAPVAALKTLPQRYRWLRKRPSSDEETETAEEEADGAWRQRWIATLRRDIEAANGAAPDASAL